MRQMRFRLLDDSHNVEPNPIPWVVGPAHPLSRRTDDLLPLIDIHSRFQGQIRMTARFDLDKHQTPLIPSDKIDLGPPATGPEVASHDDVSPPSEVAMDEVFASQPDNLLRRQNPAAHPVPEKIREAV